MEVTVNIYVLSPSQKELRNESAQNLWDYVTSYKKPAILFDV